MSAFSCPLPWLAVAALSLCGAAAAGPAAAQTAAGPLTPAQSASLDRAVQLWTSSSAGYTIVQQGDHYLLDKKPDLQGGLSAAQMQGGHLTAAARPLDGGRWQFDDIKSGMPIVITAPRRAGQAGTQTTIDLQGQGGHAVIDPSLATTSTFDGAASSATGTFDTPPAMAGSFRSGPLTTHAVWRPAGPGRIDRSSAVALGDLAVRLTGKQAVSMTAGAFHGEARIKGFSPDRFQAVMAFLRANLPRAGVPRPTPPASGTKPARSALTAADRAAMHTALDQVREVASSFDVDGAMEDVALVASGHTVRFRQVGVAEGLAAPGGRLALTYRMTFDGLSSPDIPANVREFVPHRLLLAPRLSGLSVDALFAVLGAFIDDGVLDERSPDALRSRGAAILTGSPVSIGLDALAFDVGPATLAGSGVIKVAGSRPQDITGAATIEAKGFDALLKRARTDPTLQSAAPVLIFLKGMGEQEDSGGIVWRLDYAAGHLSVNGTDLSQMLPHH